MKFLFSFRVIVIFAILFTIQSCQRKIFNATQYWKDALPKIVADSSTHYFADTLIRNKTTALAIAVPILIAKFGKRTINSEKPMHAIKVDNYWIVDGTLPFWMAGGTATVILRATDGKIMLLYHYK